MSSILDENNKQKRNKPCENCRAHRRKCKMVQGNQCERCAKMKLACVFKFTAKPTVLKKVVPISKKNRMLEQVRLMEQEMAMMEQQLKSYNVKLHLESTQKPTQQLSSSHSPPLLQGPNAIQFDSNNNDYIYDSSDNFSYSSTSTLSCECTDPARCVHSTRTKRTRYEPDPNWRLTITHGPEGMSFQTSIRNVSDVAAFLSQSLPFFTATSFPQRTPNYFSDRSHRQLIVTNRMLKIEYVLHSFFKNKKETAPLLIEHNNCDYLTRVYIKKQLIRSYFQCHGLLSPLFCQPYYLPYFESQPSSMVASGMAAFIAYSQCRHVMVIPPPLTRQGLAESFRQEAKEKLHEVLFEEEPNLLMAGTLMLLAQSSMIMLLNSEARLYTNMAWRMVCQLKDKYIDIVRDITPQTPVTPQIAEAESWRRMYYTVRYLEVYLYMSYDGLCDFSSILYENGIGSPTLLANEIDNKDIKDAVLVFYHVVRLHNSQMSVQANELKWQLFAGTRESVLVSDIEHLENQLISFWKSLPVEFRLSDSPLEYLQSDRIQQCENKYAIYLNQLYYAYWLALETRLMKAPGATDLLGANMERFDGDRALLIVSVCCDAIAKIFHILYCRLPCSVELHWLLIASDAMAMLKKAKNPHIRQRAQNNLRVTLNVLMQRVQKAETFGQINNQTEDSSYNFWTSMLPSDTSTATTSSLSGSEASTITEDPGPDSHIKNDQSPSTAYFGELKKALMAYFTGPEQQMHSV
ncbi:uncharacterized protein B0P05DRAFT_574909 [Gilbertella persicaria]|uniref:uncharacterized protein n=1 Tax=Gilbertella persicaria TaxID=101096 RepID=UPI002220DCE8|nr:uncharacterized protein B0P05DRAFT_574909 [Gilbertella persicaria]KAI8059421.1 hypothetical protein B0P05DRAFT_574909 [Gilbertella persicaria]